MSWHLIVVAPGLGKNWLLLKGKMLYCNTKCHIIRLNVIMLSVVAPYSGGLRSWKELVFVEKKEVIL